MFQSNESIFISEVSMDHAAMLENRLSASLGKELEQSLNTGFTLSASNSKDQLIAGLVAGISYGWLAVKILWVEEQYRRKGIGESLMLAAEIKAVKLNCHSAWLDTSNPVAQDFYQKMGYEVFGKLSNYQEHFPPNHRRWFMKKALIPEAALGSRGQES